ncbi:uncharacterized protein CTHT_0022260 [Thermochaetoides thermophila DSM 1495]|uniref:Uncharacterized protein n=1 Tax=Chaetomium thermophilum (strain DSM 1495 / CBS 144.50 / IMI 039719) TaxID=759272 RepID=G0S421_CHATD|nr:hypothetical protein CTHT_0022260 [Thermochaetoides thermophila DSM 1495]EGS20397.1 hypothetical protein CTHT_0022260 [Thermochaetoides thermophila DSM 1495]
MDDFHKALLSTFARVSEYMTILVNRIVNMFSSRLHPIPPFVNNDDFPVWEARVRGALQKRGLLEYIDPGVEEPGEKDSREWDVWEFESGEVFEFLEQSLGNGVYRRMTGLGWDPMERDPRRCWEMVFKAIADAPQVGGRGEVRERGGSDEMKEECLTEP